MIVKDEVETFIVKDEVGTFTVNIPERIVIDLSEIFGFTF